MFIIINRTENPHLPYMASRQTVTLSFLAHLYLLIFSFSSASRIIIPSDSDKVSVGLYYESLCPYSANFIVNYLNPLFEDKQLLSIVDLYLSPWGNAKIRGNDTIVCQHGPYECLLNTVEACAIHVWPQLEKHFPFINCIETLVYERKYPLWKSCFDKLGLDPKPVSDCYSTGYGKELELQYAAETNTLQPPHEYVPWVVVDGQPLYEDYENFVSYICKAYKGSAVPKACSSLSHYSSQTGHAKSIVPVCYKKSKMSERIRSAISLWRHEMGRAAST